MKRSEINEALRRAERFIAEQNFHLPVWAYWTPQQWASVGAEADEIRERQLGWDVTDFGSGDFPRVGLIAFTIRNGQAVPKGESAAMVKDYCEKLLLADEEQYTPTHFHFAKMEDIINRGGGRLVIQLWNAEPDTEEIDEVNDVVVGIDGIERTVPAGGKITLDPGESITLPPFLYHNFCAEPGSGMVLGGEVSRVNDDARDNRFNPPLSRFPAIEENAPPYRLLCTEYPPVECSS
ncbi:MAG: D-lyxose/D-mannose family sugar isomerase [Phycisphaerae bacterium]|nr:D-lyxose/D-mannose family sugar isomerase [Phycisphaerae bacterium]